MTEKKHLLVIDSVSIKRYRKLRLIIVVFFFIVAIRFLYLQIFSAVQLSNAAANQWIAFSPIDKPRGDILDCRNTVLTRGAKRAFILIQPNLAMADKDYGTEYPLKSLLCDRFGLTPGDLAAVEQNPVKPLLFEVGFKTAAALFKDNPQNILQRGVSVFYTYGRYDNSSIAKHLLGYLNSKDGNGVFGIEKVYDTDLRTGMIFGVAGYTDARHNLLNGLGYRILSMPEDRRFGINDRMDTAEIAGNPIRSIPADSAYVTGKTAAGEVIDSLDPDDSASETPIPRCNVRLTINADIQRIVEDVMKANNTKGAVVVVDVLDGSVAAMASMPDFDPGKIPDYLDSENKELYNRAVASYNLGSIFKIIDAAALLEMEDAIPFKRLDEFICTGSVRAGGNTFKCSSYPDGHGPVDLLEAFAVSCNSYFINAAMKIGYVQLIGMASQFGLGEETGLKKQGLEESPGLLPDAGAYYSQGDIANLAIGQGQVMATPLQVANMAAIIANGGIKNCMNVVDSIVDDDGSRIRNLRNESWDRVISANTANQIGKLMRAVMSEGTGVDYDIAGYGGSCGKTGTAETGQYENGDTIVHAWFAGYFPATIPKYSIAVFAENGRSGRVAAAPVFSAIAAEIMKRGL